MKLFLAALLLLVATVASAAQVGITTLVSDGTRNPVEGSVALEQSALRLGLTAGNARRFGANVDLVGRTSDGLTFGVGVVATGLSDSDYSAESDTTTTVRPHDSGKHIGDKHVRGGKVVVQNRSSVFSIGGTDYALVPSLLLGVTGSRVFVESRVLFDGDDVSNRVTVGVRF